jgi:hypothetical protein
MYEQLAPTEATSCESSIGVREISTIPTESDMVTISTAKKIDLKD